MERSAPIYRDAAQAQELTKIKLDPNEVLAFEISGKTPDHMLTHATMSDCILKGITPEDATALYSGTVFDMKALIIEFSKLVPDMLEELTWDSLSISLEFACEMLYKVGPAARRVSKADGDKIWKYRVLTKNSKDKSVAGTLVISTFKVNPAPIKPPTFEDMRLILTIKQASLLATEVICKLTPLALERGVILTTPLSGAIFAREDIDKLCRELHPNPDKDYQSGVINGIIASAQSGGQYLRHSKAHIAICAALVSTRNLKERSVANSIVRKTFKQYMSHSKTFDKAKFDVFAKYATGGVPLDFTPEVLGERMEELQKLKRAQLKEIESQMSLMYIAPPVVEHSSKPSASKAAGAGAIPKHK